jgi:hypothetical protein
MSAQGRPKRGAVSLLAAVGHAFEGKTTGRLPVAPFIHSER